MITKRIYCSIILLLMLLMTNCKSKTIKSIKKENHSEKITLQFLDEYTYPPNIDFKGKFIGGLSAIHHYKGTYYLVSDATESRFYKTDIFVNNKKIDTVIFKDVVFLKNAKNEFQDLDLEGITVASDKITVSSEGAIKTNENPKIIQVDSLGNYIAYLSIPEKFKANSKGKPVHNGVFEGLSQSADSLGYWSATELPLGIDGNQPSFKQQPYPIRFTYYNEKSREPEKEFVYELAPLSRPEKGTYVINGLSDILAYKKNHFFVIEREYQNGYHQDANVIKIYEAIIDDSTTNILEKESLKNVSYKPMKKRLVLDLNKIKSQFSSGIVDNIEGITYGPTLENGNKTLILISDDNFQKFSKQLNQFILLEIIEN